jgi:hypothetical protein
LVAVHASDYSISVSPAVGGVSTIVGHAQSIFGWAPDGKWLAMIYDDGGPTYHPANLLVSPPAGLAAGPTSISGNPTAAVNSFAWSPDASHVAYTTPGTTDNCLFSSAVPSTGGFTSLSNCGGVGPTHEILLPFFWSYFGEQGAGTYFPILN